MKIVYLGCDLFYKSLKWLANEHTILQHYTFESSSPFDTSKRVREICKKYNINSESEKVSIENIKQHIQDGCELFISAGYGYRIPTQIEGFYGINIHPSLLPNNRGAWPFPHIILTGQNKTGVTIHKLSEQFDAGDILIQKEFEVYQNENIYTLIEKSNDVGAELLQTVVNDFATYWENAFPQNFCGEGNYIKGYQQSQMIITHDMDDDIKDKIIRAFGSDVIVTGG